MVNHRHYHPLVNYHVQIQLSGNERASGRLVDVKADYLVLHNEEGETDYYTLFHIIEMSKNAKEIPTEMEPLDYLHQSTFYHLLKSLTNKWVYLKHAEGGMIKGIISEVSYQSVVFIYEDTIKYIPVQKIVKLQLYPMEEEIEETVDEETSNDNNQSNNESVKNEESASNVETDKTSAENEEANETLTENTNANTNEQQKEDTTSNPTEQSSVRMEAAPSNGFQNEFIEANNKHERNETPSVNTKIDSIETIQMERKQETINNRKLSTNKERNQEQTKSKRTELLETKQEISHNSASTREKPQAATNLSNSYKYRNQKQKAQKNRVNRIQNYYPFLDIQQLYQRKFNNKKKLTSTDFIMEHKQTKIASPFLVNRKKKSKAKHIGEAYTYQHVPVRSCDIHSAVYHSIEK